MSKKRSLSSGAKDSIVPSNPVRYVADGDSNTDDEDDADSLRAEGKHSKNMIGEYIAECAPDMEIDEENYCITGSCHLEEQRTIMTTDDVRGDRVRDEKEVVHDSEEKCSIYCDTTTIERSRSLLFEKYSTTSSVYTDSTMTCPDTAKQLICIASILYTQIQINEAPETKRAAQFRAGFPEFDVLLRPLKSSLSDLDGSDTTCSASRTIAEEYPVPTLDDVLEFLHHIFKQYSPAVNILSLVYLKRLEQLHGLQCRASNWQALWSTTVIIAQKMWDDTSIKTSEYVKLLPGCIKQDLSHRELTLLRLLRFNVSVKASVYARYYYELRDLFIKIAEDPGTPWEFRPVSIVKAKRLEALDQVLASRLKRANAKVYACEVPVQQKEHSLKIGLPILR